ncbi:hypothetical protein [Shewanella marisflavi]|uniref:hypothetical protein n=1 Tax=Shewanella marisflavi TaxID=260364 RepID=UPI003AAEEAAF
MERSDKTGIPALAADGNTVASDIHSEHDLRTLINSIEVNLSESGQNSDPVRIEYITLIKRELNRQKRQTPARPLHTKKLQTITIEEKSPIEHYYSLRHAVRASNDIFRGISPEQDGFTFNVRSSFGALKKGMSSARMLVNWYLHSDSVDGKKLEVKYRGPVTQARRDSFELAKSKFVEAKQEDASSEQELATNKSATTAQLMAEVAALLGDQATTSSQRSARAQFEELMTQRRHLWETMIKPNKQALEHIKGTPPSGDIDWL